MSQCTRLTDGQTDGQTEFSSYVISSYVRTSYVLPLFTALHSTQRGKKWQCCSRENQQTNDIFLTYNIQFMYTIEKQEIFFMVSMLLLRVAMVPVSCSFSILTYVQSPQYPTSIQKLLIKILCSITFTRCSAIAERPRCKVRYSFGQKWKTGSGKQYFTDITGLSSTTVT